MGTLISNERSNASHAGRSPGSARNQTDPLPRGGAHTTNARSHHVHVFPAAHTARLGELCVQRRHWLTNEQFERAIAATNLLPGPASTQLAIYCAWRLRGTRGALLGGVCFIAPGLIAII